MTSLLRGAGDFRLIPAAAVVWICTIITNGANRALSWWAFGSAAAVLLAAIGLLVFPDIGGRRRKLPVRWSLPILLAATAAVATLCVGLLRQSQMLSSPLRTAAQESRFVSVEGEIASDPRLIRNAAQGSAPKVVVTVNVTVLNTQGARIRLDRDVVVIGPATAWLGRLPGQRVAFSGRLSVPLRGDADATMSQRGPPSFIGGPSLIQRAAGIVRSELAASAQRALAPDAAALLTALVDGDTSAIDPIVSAEFRQTGLSHLLAVSGANVAIVTGAGLWIARRSRLPFAAQIGFAAFLLVGFVLVARPDPSVLRAAVMGVVTLIGLASGRPRAAIPALAAAVIVLLFVAPTLATAAGFALSVAATGGIVILGSRWTARLRRYLPMPFAMAVAVAGAAGLATAPIIVTLYPMLNLISIPANLLVAPVVAPATILGVIAAVSAPWWGALADACCWLAGFSVRWLIGVARHTSAIPEAQINWPAGAAGAALLIGAFVATALIARATRRRPVIRASVVGILVGALLVSVPIRAVIRQWPPTNWLLVACDVGQGDALTIRTGADSAIVVDAGPDPVAIDRCLSELGIEHISMLLLSHFHQDHIGGLDGVLRGRTIAEIDVSPFAEPLGAPARIARAAKQFDIPIRAAVRGEQRFAGAVQISVLGPLRVERNTRSDMNNNSVMIRVETQGVSFLLPGDAEVEEQTDLAERADLIDVDVLKVPHHGSAYQLKEFLAATRARVALVSVGADNDYGHPSPLTMSTVKSLGMTSYRTDRQGDIAVALVDGQVVVVVHQPSVPDP